MRRALLTASRVAVGLSAAAVVVAADQTVTGTWTLTADGLPLRLELVQTDRTIAGTLSYPHGAPFQLTGSFADGRLAFSGDTSGDNFTVHLDAGGSLKDDRTLAGTLTAHFVEFDDTHKVVRTRDQELTGTAVRK